jgi:hypothetical protein
VTLVHNLVSFGGREVIPMSFESSPEGLSYGRDPVSLGPFWSELFHFEFLLPPNFFLEYPAAYWSPTSAIDAKR